MLQYLYHINIVHSFENQVAEQKPYSYFKQLQTVLIIEVAILAFLVIVAFFFWTSICTDSLKSCVPGAGIAGGATFLVLSVLRPFVFTPQWFLAAIAGLTYGSFWGALISAAGSVLSGAVVMVAGQYLGKRLVKPWLTANLPATWKFLRSQDYKMALALRLVPILPFDLVSLVFGVLGFHFRRTALMTFIGTIPESYVVAQFASPDQPLKDSTMHSIAAFGFAVILPLLIMEFLSRKRGSSLWSRATAMAKEISEEIRLNNEIVRRDHFDPAKTPVLLLYGFFSSRRAVTVLEKLLVARGHQVMTFNLGGVMGTFFTKSILDTANFVDYKIKRQIERNGFKKVHVIGHSKGGLVAMWWALKLGGHKYCDKVITMGTPFAGTRLTYLALVTPLGFFWRDVWQMRPGSSFLRFLADAEISETMNIHCLHSERDGIAQGRRGLFVPRRHSERVHSIPMDHISHFEFLYRRDVAEVLSQILSDGDGGRESLKTTAAQVFSPDGSLKIEGEATGVIATSGIPKSA